MRRDVGTFAGFPNKKVTTNLTHAVTFTISKYL